MWNEKTKQLVADGKLVVIGVVQEQHAERARLYKQWKEYDFPIAQDATTSLGLTVVPVPILVDEHGYLLSARPRVDEMEQLVDVQRPVPRTPAPRLNPEQVTSTWLKSNVTHESAETKCCIGDALLREGTADSIKESLRYYNASMNQAIAEENEALKGLAAFRLGVAYRNLFDLVDASHKDPGCFSEAVKYWAMAIELNPNQYIWRRRIQQYGPRQIKPYPFYDWVGQATQEIMARGEIPVKLTIPLSGAEIAQPNANFETVISAEKNPDPDGRIASDLDRIIGIHVTVVPGKIVPGEAVRVHLRLDAENGHWNNEAEELLIWIDESKAGTRSSSRLEFSNAKKPSSDESRTLEFEFKTNDDVRDTIHLNGYALYNVCTVDDGQCLYRRQDFSIPIEIKSGK